MAADDVATEPRTSAPPPAAVMSDREHLRQAIITLRRNAWRANSKAHELERTYLAKYGGRGARARVRREIEAMNRDALAAAFRVPDEFKDLLPADLAWWRTPR